VYETVARDVRREDFPQYVGILRDWFKKCDHILQAVEQEIVLANKMAEQSVADQKDLTKRIEAAKVKYIEDNSMASSLGQYGYDTRKRDDKSKRSMSSKYLRGFKAPKPNKKE